jgi:hypothetical protein
MLNGLPCEVSGTFPVVRVTEKDPRLPYTHNFARKQAAMAEVLAKRGFSPPAGATRRKQRSQETPLRQHGKQNVAELERRKLMLELLMDRNEMDRVRFFKLQKDVSSLKNQITLAKADRQASRGTSTAAKWTTAGVRRLAMKTKI